MIGEKMKKRKNIGKHLRPSTSKVDTKKMLFVSSLIMGASMIGFSNLNVNADVNVKGQNLRVSGITTADMNHSYKITTFGKGRFDAAKLLRDYGYNLKGLDKAKLPMTVKANISGKGDKLSGNYELYSPYGEYVVEYEQLHAKGKINDLLSLNLDIDAKMSELWVGYQRLKNVSGNLNIKNNIVAQFAKERCKNTTAFSAHSPLP